MRTLHRVLGSTGLSILLSTGCYYMADQGTLLERRTTELESRITTVEGAANAQLEQAQTKVAQLEEVLQRATTVVTRNSADTGARVDELEQRVATQSGQLDELRNEVTRLQEELREEQRNYEARMRQLSRRVGIDVPADEGEIPASLEDHYRAASTAYEARELSVARGLYRAFITRYPTDPRVDDAQLRIGQSYLIEDRPATALGELRRVIADHAGGDQVPAALLAMGEAFYRLHNCSNARTSYETLIQASPRAPQATEARARLRDVQRAPAGYCTE